jgi:hypothetical protein
VLVRLLAWIRRRKFKSISDSIVLPVLFLRMASRHLLLESCTLFPQSGSLGWAELPESKEPRDGGMHSRNSHTDIRCFKNKEQKRKKKNEVF